MNSRMIKQEIIEQVQLIVKTPYEKDGIYLSDWIEDGDTEGMTNQEIADKWDELPEMETDENTP